MANAATVPSSMPFDPLTPSVMPPAELDSSQMSAVTGKGLEDLMIPPSTTPTDTFTGKAIVPVTQNSLKFKNAIPNSNTRITGGDIGKGAYGITFRLKEENGKKRYIGGAWYTLYLKNAKTIHQLSTTGPVMEEQYPDHGYHVSILGYTVRILTNDSTEEVYMYLGHRETSDGFPPLTASADDNDTYDEAPIAHEMVKPVDENYLAEAKTKRLWKPWKLSDKKVIIKGEGNNTKKISNPLKSGRNITVDDFADVYNDSSGYATSGYGHLEHGRTSMTAQDQTSWEQRYGSDPTQSAASNEAAAKSFSSTQLDNDISTKAADDEWNDKGGDDKKASQFVNVPLYQSEFDAVVDFKFNRNPKAFREADWGMDQNNNRVTSRPLLIALNSGKYTEAGKSISRINNTEHNKFSKGVTNRRLAEVKLFFQDGGGEPK